MLGVLFLALVLTGNSAFAGMPDYLRAALKNFSPEVPPGWAYTQTTTRGDVTTTEHFDPSKSPEERWTLLRYNGAAPTPGDVEKYARLKAANPAPASSAVFTKADIEPGSVEIVREDDTRTEFKCAFRAESAGADKMLAHLQLRLVVDKRTPHIESYQLDLLAPYNPVIGVKMNTLAVKVTFAAPLPDRPGLPVVSTSHFQGRIFFIGTEENLRVEYSGFTRAE